ITDGVSRLQTNISPRKGSAARRGGASAIPPEQPLQRSPGAGEPRLPLRPAPGPDLFAVADHGPPGAPRLPQHAVVPRAPRPRLAGRGLALGRMDTSVAQDHHAPVALSQQPLQRLVRHLRRGTIPPPAILVQEQAEVAPHTPAGRRAAWAPTVRRATAG